jgi:two-component system sensor kinase FixL
VGDKNNISIDSVNLPDSGGSALLYSRGLGQIQYQQQALLDLLPQAVFFKDSHFVLTSVNTAMALKLGKGREEIIGKTDYDLHAKELADKFRADDLRVITQRKPEQIEEVILVDGRVRFIETVKAPIFDPTGNVTGVMGIITDITDRKRTLEDFKRSEEIFRHVWEDSLDGMRLTDEDGTILLVNPAFCRLVKKSKEDLIGRPLTEVYEENHRATALEKHKTRFAERDIEPLFERELSLWNGDRIWFELSNSFIEMPGEGLKLLSIFRDVSERKFAEVKVKEFTTRLERSNRELQDFAYVASHDLQEPLRKVSVFGDRLKTKYGQVLGTEGLDYLQRMQKAALRMSALINDLLTFSRITTKSLPFVNVDLAKVASEVLLDLELRIEQVEGKVEIGALPIIEAEPLHMRQLLQNLIGNALKFHKEDQKPLVKVEAKIIQRPTELGSRLADDIMELTVSDNGIGFDEKYLDRIFQVFQRLHTRQNYEGTGMGLAITRKIVEHHNGSVTARSKPGEGATFVVELPVKQKRNQPI